MMQDKFDKIKIQCLQCGEEFETYIEISTGDIDPKFCSDDCIEKYYNKNPKAKLVTLNCMVCGNPYIGEEPRMCCSGRDCGCMGMPIDPMICSEECYKKLTKK